MECGGNASAFQKHGEKETALYLGRGEKAEALPPHSTFWL